VWDTALSIDLKKINLPSSVFSEKHGFFCRGGKHLFRVDYLPEAGADSSLVLCSPFAEEKVRTQRIYVSLARALAALGIAVSLFDYYGDGDSEGEFSKARFEDRLDDIRAVSADLQKSTGASRTGLLGLRWGGTMAALAAVDVQPDLLVLWEPVVDTEKYFRDHLRSNLASQMLIQGKVIRTRDQLIEDLRAGEIVTVEGYDLTGEFFFAASEAGLKDSLPRIRAKTLLVPIVRNPTRLRPEHTRLQSDLAECQLVAVPREFEWEKTDSWQPAPPQLFTETINFLDSHGFFRRVL
jgi:alpha/beta superfamily hydrolase